MDTTRHVRSGGDFKNDHHQEQYDNRGAYDSNAVHKNSAFIERGKEGKSQHKSGHISTDYATGQPISKNQNPNLDHVISGKSLHENKIRAGLTPHLETGDLAANEHNLFYTSESINKSKGAKSPEQFATYCEKNRSQWQDTVSKLEKKSQQTVLTDKERKNLKKNKELLNVDPEKVRTQGEKSQKHVNHQIDRNYYTSKDFWKTSGVSALKGGGMMALKQGTGLILIAGFEEISIEWPHLVQKWKNASDGLSEAITATCEHLNLALTRAFTKLKENAGETLKQILKSFGSGLLAEITTIIIDVFVGTLKSLVRMIRNLWTTLTNAIEVLVLNPKNLGAEEKIKAVLEILAVGTGAILQPIIAELIDKALAPYLFSSGANIIREIFAQFIGIAAGGLVSVTLLHFIENSPLAQKIISIIIKAQQITLDVCKQIGNLIGISGEELFKSRQSLLLIAGATVGIVTSGIILAIFNPNMNVVSTIVGSALAGAAVGGAIALTTNDNQETQRSLLPKIP
ncbi:hypothetical protein FAI40_02330 [Acetobacteraceae bacterium]|nr:hypothetical protein FAI40_02330 [Acetobacteraceae bacterium]